jgi:hypothetical protein
MESSAPCPQQAIPPGCQRIRVGRPKPRSGCDSAQHRDGFVRVLALGPRLNDLRRGDRTTRTMWAGSSGFSVLSAALPAASRQLPHVLRLVDVAPRPRQGPTVSSRRFQPADSIAPNPLNPNGVDRAGSGRCPAPSGPGPFFHASISAGFTCGYSRGSPPGSMERSNLFGSRWSNQWLAQSQSARRRSGTAG